jgi:hypothetical protein
MKVLKIIFAIYISLLFTGCSKEKITYTTYPIPMDWVVQGLDTYPNSFTAIVDLPDNLAVYAQDEDLVAAFIDDECRGVGNLVKSDDGTKRVYIVTVRGTATENRDIVFRYYSTLNAYLYQAKTPIPFVIDGTYGTYDEPITLDLENI